MNSNTRQNVDPNHLRAESQLDALIAKIHALSNGRTPASISEASPSPKHDRRPPTSDDEFSDPLAAHGPSAPLHRVPPNVAVPGPLSQSSTTQPDANRQAISDPTTPSSWNRPVLAEAPLAPATAPTAAPGHSRPITIRPSTDSELLAGQNVTFVPSRDEPWRPSEPDTLAAAGVAESLIEAIICRYLLNVGEAQGRAVAAQLKLPFRMVESLLARLKMDHHVAYRNSTATNDYIYVLTEAGRLLARSYQQDCSYFGACPVRLKEYVQSVKNQSVEGQHPKREDLMRAFSDLLINPRMLDKLGPAVNSGRGMFLFGYPGNGKTSIAERVTSAFGRYVWIPRAVEIEGDIMRVYDPMNHELAMPEHESGILNRCSYDKRWVRIKRPTLVAGGELTMDMLEVQCNRDSNISEAPLQMKSNCGTLVIDDFGRQKMSIDQLLNRWIIPLEKRYDFLNMSSGKKIQVPFDQLVIFSTNLEPKDLVDDAFLRRIPYKIEVLNPPEDDFRKLFEIMCAVTKIPYNGDVIDYLIKTHYLPINRPFRNCQPRDLLMQVKNYCLFNDLPIELKNEYFDFAVENYFSVM